MEGVEVCVDGYAGGDLQARVEAAYVQLLAPRQRGIQSPGTSAHAVPHSEARGGCQRGLAPHDSSS